MLIHAHTHPRHTVFIRIMKNNQLGLIHCSPDTQLPASKSGEAADEGEGRGLGLGVEGRGSGQPLHTLINMVAAAPYVDGIIPFLLSNYATDLPDILRG